MQWFPRWMRSAVGLTLLACGGGSDNGVQPPPGPTTGSLTVTLTGLPAGSNGTVNVAGPSSFSRTLSATETLTALTPGTYTIAATSVTAADGRYAPTPASQTVTVSASTTPASAAVAYALATGSLTITVSGLAAGVNGAITVTGPNSFTRAVTATTTITSLDPGAYTISATNVTTTDDIFAPAAASQSVSVSVGATPAAASVAYALTTGRLTVNISGLPAAFGPSAAINAAVTVAGPNGFQQQVTATATLTKLAPGAYTVTAADVTSSQYKYRATQAVQTVNVSASSTPASLNCTYAAIDANLTVQISGLPAGTNANVNVTGPGGFTRNVTSTTTIAALLPGSYTVAAVAITSGSTTYTPAPSSQSVSLTVGTTGTATVAYSAPVSLRLQQVVSGLSRPVHLVSPPSDQRLFIVEQTGRIRVVQNGQLVAQPFLDVTSRLLPVTDFDDEHGLLGLAFHPQYATNGFFFIFYMDPAQDLVVERYQASSNPNVAGTQGTVVLRVPHPTKKSHNGGGLIFGTDGYLYISVGDGGCCYDPFSNGQNLNTLLGKILRIDVATLPYGVPTSNPFVGQAGRRAEIWAYGLRNPWRFDIDPTTSALYIADVGEDDREEVNAITGNPAGVNYGWPLAEGTLCLQSGCTGAGLRPPIAEYDHGQGCSITGGFVYRGTQIPELQGHYFYSDWCQGFLRSLQYINGAVAQAKDWSIPSPGYVTSLGKDASGELYVLTQQGAAYKIVRQ